jgi:uncharacterized iron-regulated membrane protein
VSHNPFEEPAGSEDLVGSTDEVREKLQASPWARFRTPMRLHFYAGVFVAPFVLVAAVTELRDALIPVGYLAPLFGVSLVVFVAVDVAVDVAVGWRKSTRRAPVAR